MMRSFLVLEAALALAVIHPSRAAPARPASGQLEVPLDHGQPKAGRLKLHFERLGSGKLPAILLHGGPGAPMPAAKVLAGSEPGRKVLERYDLVYFDQRGTGRSLTPEESKLAHVVQHRARYAMDQYIEDIEAIRRKLFGQGAKLTLLGSSWGGFLGLAYAVKHARSVEALILGSFEATGWSGSRVCQNVDGALITAAARSSELGAALAAFRAAARAKKIIWRKGKKEGRVLLPSEVIEVVLPLAVKARHKPLAALLAGLVKGDPKAQAFLDKLSLDEMATAGGSLPATATFCQELVVKADLESLAAAPPPALHCDNRAAARALLKLCAPFFDGASFDAERQLPGLRVPALLFAGRWDPLIPWQATARTAARMGNATFLLISGGHTPFDEGGACLARAIDSLATRRYRYDLGCFGDDARR